MQKILVAVLVFGIVGSGCASEHGHPGSVVAEYPVQKGGHRLRPLPVLGWTQSSAVYVLYARQRVPDWQGAKKVRGGYDLGAWRLPKRSRLGFMPEATGGGVVAIAGRDEVRLPPGRYCWHARPGSTPINWAATAMLAMTIAGGVVIGVLAWWSSEWQSASGSWGIYG